MSVETGMGFDREQEELRLAVRSFLDKRSSEEEVRRLMATADGFDLRVWTDMATQLELHGLAIPEKWGGAGATRVEQGIVLEEMGRALLCGPYFSTVVLAADLLLCSGDEVAAARHLPRIASGDLVATAAVAEGRQGWDLDAVRARAERGPDGWRLTGMKTYVTDGALAELILVVCDTAEGLGLFAVDGAADGLTRTPLPTMDQTRKQARLEFTGVAATPVGAVGRMRDRIEHALLLACAALATEQAGGARRLVEASTEYAKSRVQFGRPIGAFQAVKHRLADMLMESEAARSAAYYAMFAGDEEIVWAAPLAKAYCSDAYVKVAQGAIQVFGGIGLTWEHFAHLYLKRAHSSAVLFGGAAEHRERLAAHLGL
ncbi:acyl-CoA dehydrogenase family protein [Nonomuraea purpurea]|uniref:Acyl-CoA dehydrogenase family protein n=1 Tax=Nonomuraea purpurea TaxID=1849276 RepID=A0ABV8G356_9ACTN